MPPRNGVIQKPRNAKGTLRRLGRYLWQSAPLLILALGLSVAGNLFQLIGPTLWWRAGRERWILTRCFPTPG